VAVLVLTMVRGEGVRVGGFTVGVRVGGAGAATTAAAVAEAVGEGVAVKACCVADGSIDGVAVEVKVAVAEGDGSAVAVAAAELAGVRLEEAAIARPGFGGPFRLVAPIIALVISSKHTSITIAPTSTAAIIAILRPLSLSASVPGRALAACPGAGWLL
jgi:hypothetical protein